MKTHQTETVTQAETETESPLSQHIIDQAVNALKSGSVIAYPTEAVYGLGCDPFNEAAVTQLCEIKSRPIEKGLILVAAALEQIEPLIKPIGHNAMAEVLSTWPGPFTWVFPASQQTPAWITGQFSSVAIRISKHPVIQALCQAYDRPIVSTSANLTGKAPTTDYDSTAIAFKDKISYIISGKTSGNLTPTTIRDAISGAILRH